MIYTSYYGNWRRYREPFAGKIISISRQPPFQTDGEAPELKPDQTLLTEYKTGQITAVEFTVRLNAQLDLLNPLEVADRYEGKLLLCFEKPPDFCHRHLVATWLERAGVEVIELSHA